MKKEQAELAIQLQKHVGFCNYARQEELRKQITHISHNREIPVKRSEPFTIRNMSDMDLSLLAGYIDSECCISMNKYQNSNSFRVGLDISNRSRLFTDKLISLCGGKIYIHDRGEKGIYAVWGVYGKNAMLVLDAVYPYLRQKHDQAFVALRMNTHFKNKKQEAKQLITDLKCGSEFPFDVCANSKYNYNPQKTFCDYAQN